MSETEVTGCSFLSYRRSRSSEATLLIEAQHDLGIPTWQDVRDLGEGQSEEEIRRVLRDPSTASAVVWLTSEVRESAMIRRVEIPEIIARHRQRDGFFAVLTVAGGMDYDTAADVAGQYLGTSDLRGWNLHRVAGNPIGPQEATTVARRVLRHRIRAIDQKLPSGAPLQVTINTRTPPPFQLGTALTIDWRHRFDDREATPATWKDSLLPALQVIVSTVEEHAPGRPVEVRGLASLPAATALGCAFLATRRIALGWWQYTPGRPEQLWSLDTPPESSGFNAWTEPADSRADDLAVLVSVTDDVVPAFRASRSQLPAFRAITTIAHPDATRQTLLTPGQAVQLAYLVVDEIRSARQMYQLAGTIHLYMAGPAGLAVMVGQLLNTLGVIQTYEHVATDAVGCYHPAARIHPSVVIPAGGFPAQPAIQVARQPIREGRLWRTLRRGRLPK